MTAEELEAWLKGDDSQTSGWSKDDGSGESVGHERSGNLCSTEGLSAVVI